MKQRNKPRYPDLNRTTMVSIWLLVYPLIYNTKKYIQSCGLHGEAVGTGGHFDWKLHHQHWTKNGEDEEIEEEDEEGEIEINITIEFWLFSAAEMKTNPSVLLSITFSLNLNIFTTTFFVQ